MELEVDTVITLDNGDKFLLLLEDELMDDDYFLGVLLDDNDEPTNKYIVLKQILKNGEVYTKTVKDAMILTQLLEDYQIQYSDKYEVQKNTN